MSDRGTRYTDRKMREVKRRLDRVYGQAAEDIQAKIDDFWRRHQVKDAIYRRQVANGELALEDYQAWLRGQVFQGEQWAAKREQIAKTMAHTDQIAQNIIDGNTRDIFAANANYVGYDIETGIGANIGFGLYDSSTVARLVRDDPALLPALSPKKVLEGKEIPFYQNIVTNCVTQGIIQGEGIKQIASRIANTCASRGETGALRDARTAYTGAQRQAQALGIDVMKRWMATFDFKTRPAHRELDGQIRPVDAPFEVDGEEIMYPGDKNAKGYLIYNCRCTLGWEYPKYPSQMIRRDNITGEDVLGMTYNQWYNMKTAVMQAAVKAPNNNVGISQFTGILADKQITVEQIINKISKHNGTWDTDEIIDIGRDVQNAVQSDYEQSEKSIQDEILRADQEIKRLKAERENLEDKVFDAIVNGDKKEIERLNKELEENTLDLKWVAEIKNDGLRRKIAARPKSIMDTLSSIRSFGGVTDQNFLTMIENAAGNNPYDNIQHSTINHSTKKTLIDGMNYYPSEWLVHSRKNKITLHPIWTSGRAHYGEFTGEIALDGEIKTSINEMSHRMEHSVPGMLDAERQFYDRRTVGDALEPMSKYNKDYRQNELTRRDKFLDPYMGKDYNGTAYELASMGFESIFTEYDKLAQSDAEMLQWLFGLLVTL